MAGDYHEVFCRPWGEPTRSFERQPREFGKRASSDHGGHAVCSTSPALAFPVPGSSLRKIDQAHEKA